MYSYVDCITNKIDEIKVVMALKPEVDVFAFTEVKSKWTSTLFTETPGFKLFINFAKQEGRGVALYTRAFLKVPLI